MRVAAEPRGVRIGGVPVRVHWSVLVILVLFTDSLAVSLLPASAAGYPTAAYWGVAAGCGVAFMLCLFVHEFSHALVAKHVGLRARRITLWMLGGVARLDGQARTPRADFEVAVAGPTASAVCSLLFWAASFAAQAAGAGRLTVAALVWLAWANGVVAVFNLLPGAPLDGGRVLRALLWWRGGDRDRAAATAERAGSVLGLVLAGLGIVAVFAGDFSGLWLVLLGLFMGAAARAEHEADRTAHIDVTVAEVMTPDPVCAPGWYTLPAFLDWITARAPQHAYPVVDFTGRPVGVIVLDDLLRSRQPTPTARVVDVARPLSRVAVVAPDSPALSVLMDLRSNRSFTAAPALVVDGGRLVGTVEPSRLAAALQVAALRRRFAQT
jgi:Zn-dependent protease